MAVISLVNFLISNLLTENDDKVNDGVTSKHADSGDRCLINGVDRRSSSHLIHSITV
jgi:hypothetical protein